MFPDPTVFPDPTEFISEFILPSFRKILVTHDGKDKSNKAINYAIYLSKLSGAEITILQIINDAKQLRDTSGNISNNRPYFAIVITIFSKNIKPPVNCCKKTRLYE